MKQTLKRAGPITKLEGKKISVSVGNVREVLAREEDLIAAQIVKRWQRVNGYMTWEMGSPAYRELQRNITRKVRQGIKALNKLKKVKRK